VCYFNPASAKCHARCASNFLLHAVPEFVSSYTRFTLRYVIYKAAKGIIRVTIKHGEYYQPMDVARNFDWTARGRVRIKYKVD